MFSSLLFGQENCNTKLAQTQIQAQKEHKKILLYFSGSDWCKPCILLKKKVLNNETFKEVAAQKYVILNYDFPQRQEGISKQEIACREEVAAQFNSDGAFPKLVLIDHKGKILKEINGYRKQTPNEILAVLEE